MIRLLHLSDPHFGASDSLVADAFLERARSLSPDHTILSGDLTMRARRNEFDESRRFTAGLPRPLLVIPGNHDVPAANQPLDRFFNPFRRYRKNYGDDLEPEFDDGNIHILSLNSTRAFGWHADWSDGFLSDEQLAAMNRGFRKKSGRFKILVLHHPLLAPLGRQRSVVRPLAPLLAAIDEANVDLVLCGHFHRSQIATAGKIDGWKCVVSQAPTVCSTRLQGEPQGFHMIAIHDDRIEVTLHQVSEGKFVPLATRGFERGVSGWSDCGFQETGEVVSLG